jgi:hypothetical protein
MRTAVIVIVVLAAAAAFLIRTRWWPLGPCPRCRGRRGRGRLSTSGAFNHWCRCGGSGERIRPLSLIWARHRATARRMREQAKKARQW